MSMSCSLYTSGLNLSEFSCHCISLIALSNASDLRTISLRSYWTSCLCSLMSCYISYCWSDRSLSSHVTSLIFCSTADVSPPWLSHAGLLLCFDSFWSSALMFFWVSWSVLIDFSRKVLAFVNLSSIFLMSAELLDPPACFSLDSMSKMSLLSYESTWVCRLSMALYNGSVVLEISC